MSDRKTEIARNLQEVKERTISAAQSVNRDPNEIQLIVVTKTFPISDIEILRELGEMNFGENRDQEAGPKAETIPATWHFQGQIQSNKLKSISSWASVIHSLDDPRHFEIIERVAPHPLQIFLQVSLDGAHNRGGAALDDLYALAALVEKSPTHTLAGLMSVPPIGMDPNQGFAQLALIHKEFMKHFPSADSLSAGMSGDYEKAISHGATHVRVGSSILGSRSPHL
jgi:pyridoxal phosphate enzyme (YggS family)